MTEPVALFVDDKTAAHMLGLGHDIFRRTWSHMVEKQGLPAPEHPLKRDGKPSSIRRWNRLALERWAEKRMPPELRAKPAADPLAGARAALDARLDGMDKKAS